MEIIIKIFTEIFNNFFDISLLKNFLLQFFGHVPLWLFVCCLLSVVVGVLHKFKL